MRIATASASGMEWLTAKNSHSNGPSRSRRPSRTVSVYGSIRRSASFASTSASVNCEPDQRDVGLVREQVRHRADVVLVAVGEHDRLDVVEPVQDRREVGQDQVDAGLVDVGEQHSAVDDQQLAAVLEDGHVAADGAEPAERDDPQAALRAAAAGSCHARMVLPRSLEAAPRPAQSARSCATLLVGRVHQRRAHRAGRQAERFSAALTRIVPWVRKMPVKIGSSWLVQRSAAATSPRSYASIISLVPAAAEVGRGADDADAADRQQRQRERVVAGVEGQVGAARHPGRRGEVALGVLDRRRSAGARPGGTGSRSRSAMPVRCGMS